MFTKQLKKLGSRILGKKGIQYYIYFRDKRYLEKFFEEKTEKLESNNFTNVAIIFIATGKYMNFFKDYYESVKHYFLKGTKKKFFIFTDKPDYPGLKNKDIEIFLAPKLDWPLSTLMRYKFILSAEKKLKKYSHIIYIDADMKIMNEINQQDLLPNKEIIFGVRHPDFVNPKVKKRFETDLKSISSIRANEKLDTYWQGCFWGGESKAILKMIKKLSRDVDLDLKKGIIPICWDESYLNRYFIDNQEKLFTVSPLYAYPNERPISKKFKIKITHITNKDKSYQK